MRHTPLATYLKMYRRKVGLSQREVAYLLGFGSITTVSNHERGVRIPDLDTALGYQFLLSQPVGDIFSGRAEQVAQVVTLRAEELLLALGDLPQTPLNKKKIAILQDLISAPQEPRIIPIWNE